MIESTMLHTTICEGKHTIMYRIFFIKEIYYHPFCDRFRK